MANNNQERENNKSNLPPINQLSHYSSNSVKIEFNKYYQQFFIVTFKKILSE